MSWGGRYSVFIYPSIHIPNKNLYNLYYVLTMAIIITIRCALWVKGEVCAHDLSNWKERAGFGLNTSLILKSFHVPVSRGTVVGGSHEDNYQEFGWNFPGFPGLVYEEPASGKISFCMGWWYSVTILNRIFAMDRESSTYNGGNG